MEALGALQDRIARELEQLPFPVQPADLYDPIRYTLALGGKRLRPALCVLGALSVGGTVEDALKPALGVEVFHNFTLLHDDIMDAAPLRRNRPTVYSKWNTNVAILSGDVMFAEAFRLVSEAPAPVLKPVIDVFLKAAVEVCEGQQWDMDFEARADVSIDAYLNMIRMKTAVLLGAALEIGARCGGGTDADARSLYEFGSKLGIAFQLMDDVLDVYGDPDKFGKRVGGDIVANKKTYLKLRALEKAHPKDREELMQWYSEKPEKEEEKIAAVRQIFDRCNVRSETEKLMDRYYEEALEALSNASLMPEYRKALVVFAEKLMARES
jgi:geranylgeranyl diphosphate synthase type II